MASAGDITMGEKPADSSATEVATKKPELPPLQALEEDDEFEEFRDESEFGGWMGCLLIK
jgi:hypothetical protein